MATIERTVRTSDGCLIWRGARTSAGYGSVFIDGRVQAAHRVVWEEVNGRIEDGLTLDHLCRNRACVNPEHLEPVTQAENNRRARVSRAIRGQVTVLTHCPQGHELTAVGVYRDRKRGTTYCRECKRIRNAERVGAEGRIVVRRSPWASSRIDYAHLVKVAEVYSAAAWEGKPPTEAVREQFGTSLRTASYWVQKAEERLGWTRPRRGSSDEGVAL